MMTIGIGAIGIGAPTGPMAGPSGGAGLSGDGPAGSVTGMIREAMPEGAEAQGQKDFFDMLADLLGHLDPLQRQIAMLVFLQDDKRKG